MPFYQSAYDEVDVFPVLTMAPGVIQALVMKEFQARYQGDIDMDLWILNYYAQQVDSVVELGVWHGTSTAALLAAQPKKLRSIDIRPCPNYTLLQGIKGRTEWTFEESDDLVAEPSEHDLLFIDALHTYAHVKAELERWAPHCKKWIIMHDTLTCGVFDETGNKPGINEAWREYIEKTDPDWRVELVSLRQSGMTVFARKSVIPHRFMDALREEA